MVAIILASGFSQRMGTNKLLLPYQEKPILQWVIEGIEQLHMEKIILVYREEAVKSLVKNRNIQLIYNEEAIQGQSQAVIKGLQAVDESVEDYMFFMGDQPLLVLEELKEMIRAYGESPASIAVPYYEEKPGAPVIFSKRWRRSLLQLRGDSGGRRIIRDNQDEVLFYPIKQALMGWDIDTQRDYEELLKEDM
ncbi:conserved hypothetical protein, possibly involved in molybdenum cofactor biosynthesis [Alkaliphilus metalliredigens QYMF]|uniref:MobA-like NTP transferase domain-containing protein n=1 Tax=Alkaliphilus metalliredigens (strain QYMF) TaxID=293826 RepID=A6TWR8_ALKMQ|nr:nucleotidyltransferase family protein [Alkaliphilus metalliredigens]ABR50636.1 conserved hypothetical protein, possibly involved in molybdenum cofactor biosynthesis [Alkaliphilus metalliredigens QYMF]